MIFPERSLPSTQNAVSPDAPAAFIVTSNTDAPGMHKDFHKSDVTIAITYGTVAAEHRGLATFWIGLAEIAFKAERRLGSEYAIPRNERVDGIVAVGYSGSKWMQLPPRGPVKAVWLYPKSRAHRFRSCRPYLSIFPGPCTLIRRIVGSSAKYSVQVKRRASAATAGKRSIRLWPMLRPRHTSVQTPPCKRASSV